MDEVWRVAAVALSSHSDNVLGAVGEEGTDVVDGDVEQAGAGFVRGPGDMRRDKGVRLS